MRLRSPGAVHPPLRERTEVDHSNQRCPLIANRISNYAKLVGRENVIAGSDCGYGTWVGQAAVDPDVVWAKFAALAEGARIATKRFWK
jgi:methionine synthase II (cobalamin-independent)